MPSRQVGSNNAGSDLLERGVASGGNVVSKRCETAVVGGSQSIHRNVLRCFKHTVSHLLRAFDIGIDRISDADEDQLIRLGVLAKNAQHALPVRLAGQLYVEPPSVQIEQVR